MGNYGEKATSGVGQKHGKWVQGTIDLDEINNAGLFSMLHAICGLSQIMDTRLYHGLFAKRTDFSFAD